MANTIAHATGYDSTGRSKYVHRLGGMAAKATAATYRTFAEAYVTKDGSGYVEVKRDGVVVHVFTFEGEA